MRINAWVAAGMGAAAMAGAARGQSFYEGFGYSAAALVSGGTGGMGFSSAWNEAGQPGVRVGTGLTYNNGGDLVTTPGAAAADPARSFGGLTRLFTPGLPTAGEVWMSCLVRVELAATSYALLTLQGTGPGASSYAFSVARASPTAMDLRAAIAPYPGGGSGGVLAPELIAPGSTVLLVARLQLAGAAAPDSAALWVNPRLDVPLGAPSATLSTINLGSAAGGGVRFELGAFATSVIDEIRVGDSAAAVLPVAPAACLADVAGLGGSAGSDGQLTVDDVVFYLQAFFAGDLTVADLVSLGGSPPADGAITADDVIAFLGAFFGGCP
ncbi:MAG: GC-type dockerin domain-anchored protein [Phycisphaerales bacterium]